MNLLGLSVWYRAQQILGRDPAEPADYYKGEYVRDIAARVLREFPDLPERPEAEILDLCRREAQDEILAGIKADLANFRAEHQVWFSERSLIAAGAVDRAFADLRARDFAYDRDGAFWFATTRLGDDKDRVLRKSDGSLTYFASDIAYHHDKYGRGFDQVVDIWGADHHGYVPRMKAAVQALGRDADDLQVILVQLVNLLRGGEPVAMSTAPASSTPWPKSAPRWAWTRPVHVPVPQERLPPGLRPGAGQAANHGQPGVLRAVRPRPDLLGAAQGRGARLAAGEPGPAALSLLSTPEDLRLLKLLAQFRTRRPARPGSSPPTS
jgi:arginyl-tRNA synthetase